MAIRAKSASADPSFFGAPHLLPISDTVNGTRAREAPAEVVAHYERLAERLWLPPQLEAFAGSVLDGVRSGRATWASLTGPYGFGKTAAGVLLWQHARQAGFLAIPPLSCTNYDEFAAGVAAVAEIEAPKHRAKVRKLYDEIWTGGLDRVARLEARRHELPLRKLRKVFEEQFSCGRWTPDGHSHRLVEFLAGLGELAAKWSSGLVVVVDELQQLLGPLDVSSLSRLREFVWGMRTEQSPCAVVLSLDTQLEARLSHWAADLLHRVREHSPALQMTNVFNRDFPRWLWERHTAQNGRGKKGVPAEAATPAILESLGQFVERPDLANGPRTVVDVFNRAVEYHASSGESYDIPQLVDDLHQGRFRFFGEGTPVQRVLTQLLSDSWVDQNPVRRALVRTLAAFPRGCPPEVVHAHAGNGRKLKAARDELFGPLLVQLPGGLALEPLQQVSRGGSAWEQVLARCWDSMPSVSALGEGAPELVERVLFPKLFPGLGEPNGQFAHGDGDARSAADGFRILRGSYDPAYPSREVAVWVGRGEPTRWPDDVDLCLAIRCQRSPEENAQPSATLANLDGTPRILLTMPTLAPLDGTVPPELSRYHKYVQPEPLRPVFVLLALRDLEFLDGPPAHLGNGKPREKPPSDTASVAESRRLRAFCELCLDYLASFLVQGDLDAGVGRPVLDILLLARFPERARFVPFLNFQRRGDRQWVKPDEIRVASLSLVVEVKDNDQSDVRFEGTRLEVRYHRAAEEEWHGASEQSNKQVYALRNYLAGHGLDAPYTTNLIWLRQVPNSQLPPRPHNCLGSGLTWELLLNVVAQLNPPFERDGEWVLRAWRGEVPLNFMDVVRVVTQRLQPTRLDNLRMARLARSALEGDWAPDVGNKQLILRGRGGTGKTMLLLQLAWKLYQEQAARVLLLTYNKALMADLRRLLTLVGASDPGDARCVQVQSVHSFLGSVFRELNLLDVGEDLLEHYSRLKGEALELLRAGALGPADIEKLFRERPESFGWDYLLVDEGQDWPEDERDLLRALYPASRFAVADGMDQFVRTEQPCDWRAGLSRSAVRVVSLGRCLRLKAVLARFANALAAELGLAGWQVEENPDAPGGRVVVTERGYFSDRCLHDRLMRANEADGNQPVDTLVCVPPASVVREEGTVRSTAAGMLEQWGHAVWDGVSTEVRDSYAHSVTQVRVVQYDSCRGLEGWVVVLIGLDELYRYKLAAWKPPGGDYSDDPAAAGRFAARWVMIPVTRAVDTLVIELGPTETPLHRALRRVASLHPDFVEWRTAETP